MHQLLVQQLDIAYISNVFARYWKSPYLGACISRIFKPSQMVTDYSSSFGITKEFWEPNEWGYYWRRSFGIDLNTGMSRSKECFSSGLDLVGKQVSAMQSVTQTPIIFDNLDIFHYLSDIATAFENSLFVHINRDTFYVANSILNAKLSRFGDLDSWYALRPQNHEKISRLHPVEQCVAQVHSIEKDLKRQIQRIDKKRILSVEYEELCKDPEQAILNFRAFVNTHGFQLKLRNNAIPNSFISRNEKRMIRPEYKNDLLYYYKQYFNTNPDL